MNWSVSPANSQRAPRANIHFSTRPCSQKCCNILLYLSLFSLSSTLFSTPTLISSLSQFLIPEHGGIPLNSVSHVRMSLCALLILCALLAPVSGSLQERRLYEDLMRNYNNLERPVANHSEPVTVHLKVGHCQWSALSTAIFSGGPPANHRCRWEEPSSLCKCLARLCKFP